MAGRHTRYENGVVTTITGALMLGPDAEEARQRIKKRIAEAQRAVAAHDFTHAERILTTLDVELVVMGRELNARIVEIKDGTQHAFGDLKLIAVGA